MKHVAVLTVLAIAISLIGPAQTAQAATQTRTVRYGPFVLPAATEAGPGMVHNQGRFFSQRPCIACHITSFTPDLVYEDGTPATMDEGAMLHHMVLSSLFRRDATCANTPGSIPGERFFASGDERTSITFPTGYGYPVRWFDAWFLLVDLMNHATSAQTVYVEVTYTYRPTWEPVEPLNPVWLDIDQCGDSEYSIPAGHSDTHSDWDVNVPGDVIAAAGHMHGHGMFVEATNESNGGESICRSEATMHPTDMHLVMSMTTCTDNPLASIEQGDIVRLHSEYHSPMPMDDVMGIMILYVHQE